MSECNITDHLWDILSLYYGVDGMLKIGISAITFT